MVLQALVIALLFAEPAAAAGPAPGPAAPATTPAPVAAPAAPAVDPVFAEIDRLMAPWKGKSVGDIQGRFGLTETIKEATNGKVIFWIMRTETMSCGVGEGGAMRCASLTGALCRLGVAVDKEGKITNWKANGGSEACKKFVAALAKP